jgi:ribosomal silencing factor RsfS
MHTDPGKCDQRAHLQVAEILKDSKTNDVTVLDVRPRQCDFTDEMVIATARSKLHCQSAAQAVVYRVRPFPLT